MAAANAFSLPERRRLEASSWYADLQGLSFSRGLAQPAKLARADPSTLPKPAPSNRLRPCPLNGIGNTPLSLQFR